MNDQLLTFFGIWRGRNVSFYIFTSFVQTKACWFWHPFTIFLFRNILTSGLPDGNRRFPGHHRRSHTNSCTAQTSHTSGDGSSALSFLFFWVSSPLNIAPGGSSSRRFFSF